MKVVELMTHMSIMLGTSSSSSMAHGFVSEMTYSELNLMKPTTRLNDLKMMKIKLKANCKRFGVFFAESLNASHFNRSGYTERCVIYSINVTSVSLKYMQFMKGFKTERYNTASRIRNHCATIFQVPEVDLMNAEVRKAKFRDRIGWVDNGNGGGSYSTVDVEILHKNYGGEYSLSSIFLNPILMGVSIHYVIDIQFSLLLSSSILH